MATGDSASSLLLFLGGMRTSFGIVAWVSPRLSAKVFGMDKTPHLGEDENCKWMSRLFGAREGVLGASVLYLSHYAPDDTPGKANSVLGTAGPAFLAVLGYTALSRLGAV
eukprot:gene45685-64156_t